MKQTRIDVVSIRYVFLVSGVAIVILVLALVLGQIGPLTTNCHSFSTFNCTDQEHYVYDPLKCHGKQLREGVWSERMSIGTTTHNKYWFCLVIPYLGIDSDDIVDQDILLYIDIEGKEFGKDSWQHVLNDTRTLLLACPTTIHHTMCPLFVAYSGTVLYEINTISVKFESIWQHDLTQLADVVFDLCTDNPEYTKMELALKVTLLLINIAVIVYHYHQLRAAGTAQWANWTEEQRLLIFLLLALIGFNNPLLTIDYFTYGWILPFLGATLEVSFMSILFFLLVHYDK